MHLRLQQLALAGGIALCLLEAIPSAMAQTPPSAQAPTGATLALSIADGLLPKELRLIKVRKGDHIRWRISSDTAGEFHLHAYRLSATLQAGQTTEMAFTAFATGRFRLEWHSASGTSAPSGGHHAPPLAFFEVLPR